MQPLNISVVIPTFNREATLQRSIDSVRLQSVPVKEILIIDDGSQDETRSLVESIQDDRIKYFHQTNKGANSARNFGIDKATGYWIALHDSDDVWEANKIEIMSAKIKELQNRGNIDMGNVALFHTLFRIDKRTGQSALIPAALIEKYSSGFDSTLQEINQLSILLGNFVSSQTLVMPRETLLEMGGLDDSLKRYTDWELAIRIAATMQMVFINEPLVVQYIQSDSISNDIREGHVARKMIFRKHKALYRKNLYVFFRQWLRIHYRAILDK